MPEVVPGLDDPLVAANAARFHVPEERWVDVGNWQRPERSISLSSPSVRCETCHQKWPCATRVALRQLGTGHS